MLKPNKILYCLIKALASKRAKLWVSRISPYLHNSEKIVDIGCGGGLIAKILIDQGKKVTPVDVTNHSLAREIKPIIYNGQKLPFVDKSFDTALLLMVLHHTPKPELVFQEATRVAKEVLVVEDVYSNIFHKLITVLFDSLVNLYPKFHWQSYRKDENWRKLFESAGFKIAAVNFYWDWFVIPYRHVLYFLKRS